MAQSNSPTAPPQVASPKKSRSTVPVKRKRRRLLITVGLLALVSVTGLLSIFYFASQTTPLRLAIVTTLTGPNAWMGQESLQAVKLLVDKVNQDGGVNKHRIELLPSYDDKFDAKTDKQANGAKEAARQIVASDALMVLGPTYSQAALVSNPIYKAAQIPSLSGTISSDRWTKENPCHHR
jgi:ABC-type branched-subunit amino acid transport system substrate-binding protein